MLIRRICRNKRASIRSIIIRRKICAFPLIIVTLWILHDNTTNTGFTYLPCKIPVLDPWDESLDEFIDYTAPGINCSERYNLFFVDHRGILQLNSTTVKLYNINLTLCVYRVITRDGDNGIEIGDEIVFSPPIFIEHEVFCVICNSTGGQIVYRYVHVNVMGISDKEWLDDIAYEQNDQLSVIIIIIDSLSRSHALRFLPKSYSFLTKTLGAFDLRGYMKVGVNSFPNAVALLTGTPATNFLLQTYKLQPLDNIPFIWKETSMRKYVSHLNEDMPHIATFSYFKLGFTKQPVDYYYRLYALAMHLIDPLIVEPLENTPKACYGNADHLDLQIDYFKRFVTQNTDRLKFALLWNNHLGHSDFNMMSRGDDPLLNLIQWLNSSGHLDHSVLFFGSDHGFRLGGADTTYVGRLENNLPLMTVRIPDVVLKRYPHIRRNLEYNSDKLTSPFDIYETMKAIINRKFSYEGTERFSNGITRRSLFQKVPKSRNCVDAGIPQRYCTCSESKPIDFINPVLKVFGAYCIDHLNDLLKGHADRCKPLILHNITDVRFSPIMKGDPPDVISFENFMDYFGLYKRFKEDEGRYTIMFYTDPNKGLFEIMLDYNSPIENEGESVRIIGDPIRINVYGNESHCVEGGLLKQICLCYS